MSRQSRHRRPVDPPRRVAYDALRAVHSQDAYANLVLPELLTRRQISGRDAAFATELVHGTCRAEGSYDAIIAAASGRALTTMQPAVLDVLRLGTHQLLAMRVPVHAAVDASVDLAAQAIGERVTGLVNAVLRKVAQHDRPAWNARLRPTNPTAQVAFEHDHPEWIVQSFADALDASGADVESELAALLAANNAAPTPTLVVRPGLFSREDLVTDSGGQPTLWSPFGVHASGFPGDLAAVRSGRAAVQDEGSQLVAWALTQVPGPPGPWLDMCAGPGGKTALLRGLAQAEGAAIVAADPQVHRARLVAQALRAYSAAGHTVLAADGTRPAWSSNTFARVLVDVPCSGLGALRRRPESRWRRTAQTITTLAPLQRSLLHSALDAARPARADAPGGVVAYVTCSPHVAETDQIVEAVLAQRRDTMVLDARQFFPDMPNISRREVRPGAFSVQLWPHRHHTDAMYLCLLQRT